jgi:hypothetical protein
MTLTYFISTNESGEVIGYGHGYGEAGMQPAINEYFTDYAEFLTRLQAIDVEMVYAEVIEVIEEIGVEEIAIIPSIVEEEIIVDTEEEA